MRIITKSQRTKAFTLIELLAVVMVVALLAGLMLGVAGYVQKNMQIQTTRTQIALIGAALEGYKADYGYYPRTTPVRISNRLVGEATNNWYLYRALVDKGKYLKGFPLAQVRPNFSTASNSLFTASALTNIFDVYGTPFNYFNSPATTYALCNNVNGVDFNCGYTMGGQVNIITYDLFSYGADRLTFVRGLVASNAIDVNRPWSSSGWVKTNSNDINNWTR